jgi:hypothetical protein
VSGQIFGLTSREIKTVQIFLHNECLQNIRGSLVNLITMFDLKKNMNLEVKSIKELEVEAHDDCKFEQKVQGSTHQDHPDSIDKVSTLKQDDQDLTYQEYHDSIHQADQDSTHQEDQASLDTLSHSIQYETRIINFLQGTSYKDSFQSMCHSSSLHSSMMVQEN